MVTPSPVCADRNYGFRACGLTIRSSMLLPLSPYPVPSEPDVVVHWRAETAGDRVGGQHPNQRFTGNQTRFSLTVPALGCFSVTGGAEIIVPPHDAAQALRIGATVLGSIMPHLCHQRGLVPLHAGTALLNGGAIALAGRSGIGKSTLMAAFARHGHPILSDDLCAVDLSGISKGGPPMARACGPWVKLQADLSDTRWNRMGDIGAKTWLDLTERFHDGPAPLSAILLITDAAEDAPVTIRRQTGRDAIGAANQVVSRWHQAQATQGAAALFGRIGALFGSVGLYRLSRPRSLACLDDVVTAVEHFARCGAAA